MAEAELFRSAAKRREQALLAQLAKAKLDHENLAQVLQIAQYHTHVVVCITTSLACRTFPQLRVLQTHWKTQVDNMTKRSSKSKMRLGMIAVTFAEPK